MIPGPEPGRSTQSVTSEGSMLAGGIFVKPVLLKVVGGGPSSVRMQRAEGRAQALSQSPAMSSKLLIASKYLSGGML